MRPCDRKPLFKAMRFRGQQTVQIGNLLDKPRERLEHARYQALAVYKNGKRELICAYDTWRFEDSVLRARRDGAEVTIFPMK